MKVHVTGGSGFLGSHILTLLVKNGYEVTALARSQKAADRVRDLGAEPITGDLDDPTSVEEAFEKSGADTLVNLASLGFGHAPTIVRAAEKAQLQRAIFISTTAIFTRLPAKSKAVRLAAERVIRESSLDWTILRPTMIYGALGDRNMERLLILLKRFPLIPLPGGGNALQQPVHVEDLARTTLSCIQKDIAIHRAYEVAGPTPVPLRALIRDTAALMGRKPLLFPIPLRPSTAIIALYERLVRTPRLQAHQIARLAEHKNFSIESARRDLDHTPRPLLDGLMSEIRELQNNTAHLI